MITATLYLHFLSEQQFNNRQIHFAFIMYEESLFEDESISSIVELDSIAGALRQIAISAALTFASAPPRPALRPPCADARADGRGRGKVRRAAPLRASKTRQPVRPFIIASCRHRGDNFGHLPPMAARTLALLPRTIHLVGTEDDAALSNES
jgi:hypothetical protein